MLFGYVGSALRSARRPNSRELSSRSQSLFGRWPMVVARNRANRVRFSWLCTSTMAIEPQSRGYAFLLTRTARAIDEVTLRWLVGHTPLLTLCYRRMPSVRDHRLTTGTELHRRCVSRSTNCAADVRGLSPEGTCKSLESRRACSRSGSREFVAAASSPSITPYRRFACAADVAWPTRPRQNAASLATPHVFGATRDALD